MATLSLGGLSLSLGSGVELHLLETIAAVIVSGLFFWILSRFVRTIGRVAGVRPSTDRAIRDTISILWAIAIAFSVLSIWNLTNEFSVLTVSGIAGLVVSLALQSTLGNIIAGVFLLRDQLLRVGDEVEYGSVRGTVIRVAMRNTWVLSKDGTVAVIGNTSLASGPLINHSASKSFATRYDWRTARGSVPSRVGPASPGPGASAPGAPPADN